MTQTDFDLQQRGCFGLNSSKMKFIRNNRIDLIHCILKFFSNLRFEIYLKFGI